jgi:hypothetical protein
VVRKVRWRSSLTLTHAQVLKRLEKHPLAHASGWDLSAQKGPSLGGKKWQKENDKLEKQLENMSDSVNQSESSLVYLIFFFLRGHVWLRERE